LSLSKRQKLKSKAPNKSTNPKNTCRELLISFGGTRAARPEPVEGVVSQIFLGADSAAPSKWIDN
jgi:hypothetical protein